VERLRGYTVAEVMAQDMQMALTQRSRAYLEQILPQRIADFKQNRRYYYVDEIEQPCRDDTTVWTEATTHYRINEADGHLYIYGASRNITERKQIEEALRKKRISIPFTFQRMITGFAVHEIISMNGPASGLSLLIHQHRF